MDNFQAYYFSEEYGIDCIDGSMEFIWIETSINSLKGTYHLECIEKLKETQDFKDNEKSLKIDSYEININSYINDRYYSNDGWECEHCKKILDEKIITEIKKLLEIYKECRNCETYSILKSDNSIECDYCVQYNKQLDYDEIPFPF
jgi:hypothetical protein